MERAGEVIGGLMICMAFQFACGGRARSDGDASYAGATSSGAGGGGALAGMSSNDLACTQPQSSGDCDQRTPSFWHNPSTGLCEPFTYSGCDGNSNRYQSREDCLDACGAGNDWSLCVFDEDCALAKPGCCAACEATPSSSLVALNKAYLGQFSTYTCDEKVSCEPWHQSASMKDR